VALDLKVLLGYVDETGAGFKTTEARIDSIANKAAKAGRVMTVAGAAITGTIVGMTLSAAKYADEIAKASQITGIGTEELSKLRFAAEQSGLEFSALQMSLRGMVRSAAEAADGMEQYSEAYERLGVDVKKADGSIKNSEELIADLAEGFSKMEEGTLKAATAQEIFGGRGVALLPLLNQGAEGVAELTARAEELGLVVDQDTAVAAERLNDSLNEVKLAAMGLGQSLVDTLGPSIADTAEKIAETVGKISEWAEKHPKLAQFVIKAAAAIGLALGVGGPILMALPHLIGGIRLVTGAFTQQAAAANTAAVASARALSVGGAGGAAARGVATGAVARGVTTGVAGRAVGIGAGVGGAAAGAVALTAAQESVGFVSVAMGTKERTAAIEAEEKGTPERLKREIDLLEFANQRARGSLFGLTTRISPKLRAKIATAEDLIAKKQAQLQAMQAQSGGIQAGPGAAGREGPEIATGADFSRATGIRSLVGQQQQMVGAARGLLGGQQQTVQLEGRMELDDEGQAFVEGNLRNADLRR
jgi:hypothetical protein